MPSTYFRRGDWKLIRFHGDGDDGEDRFELYNLKDDIGEARNLAGSKPKLVRQMDGEISRYLTGIEAVVPRPIDVKGEPAAPPAASRRSPKTTPPRRRRSPEALFKARDRNEDGFVTLEEYIGDPSTRNVPALTRRFNRLDTSKDSRLTLEEMKGGN